MSINALTSFTEEDFKIFADTQLPNSPLNNRIKKKAMEKLGDLVQKPAESGFYYVLSTAVQNANLNQDDQQLFNITQLPDSSLNNLIKKNAMTQLGYRIQHPAQSGFYNALVAHICSPSLYPSKKKSVARPC